MYRKNTGNSGFKSSWNFRHPWGVSEWIQERITALNFGIFIYKNEDNRGV
jgi:hypothetical protein